MLALQQHLHRIDNLIANNQARKNSNEVDVGSPWAKDTDTTQCCLKLAELSSSISQSCIKCAMISTTAGTSAMESMLQEIGNNYEQLIETFWIFVGTSPSFYLLNGNARCVRSLVKHGDEFLHAVSSGSQEQINLNAGIMEKIAEDLGKLPKSNKVACRRFVLEKCTAIKDSIREFQEYVATATETTITAETGTSASLADASIGRQDDAASDDDSDDEVRYISNELPIVVCCISLMEVALSVVKGLLSIMTTVCDAVSELTAVIVANQSVFACDVSNGASSSPDAHELEIAVRKWTARLLRQTDIVYDSVTDLGAELYPPDLEENENIFMYFIALRDSLKDAISILQDEQFLQYQTSSQIENIVSIKETLINCVFGQVDVVHDSNH